MTPLTLQQFLAPSADFEAQQYRILHTLAFYRQSLHREVLYPGLAELIEVYQAMATVLQSQEVLENSLRQKSKASNESQGLTPNRTNNLEPTGPSSMFNLIRWAMPLVKELIDEGATMFSFIEQNVEIEEIGIVPIYTDEGYFMVPERRKSLIHIYQFETSIYTKSDEQYRALKTVEVRTIRESIEMTPERIKQDLLEDSGDMPNALTCFCKTDLEFPFEASMLPVAKRKLMSYLYSRAS